MIESAPESSAAARCARLESVVDELAGLSLDTESDDEVIGLLRQLEIARRRLSSIEATVIAQLVGRGVPTAHGTSSTTSFLTRLLGISSTDARGRVVAAENFAPRQIAGQILEPPYPQVSAAHAAGAISSTHARLAATTLRTLPTAVTDEHFGDLEGQLVGWAHEFSVDQFARLARHLHDVLDPDGTLRDERHHERVRDLTVRQRPDGSVCGSFEGTAEFGEALLTVLDKLAAPHPTTDEQRDARTPGQRRHDGMLDALKRVLRSGELGTTHGVSTTILVTMTEQQLRTGEGLARTGHGATIPVRAALKHLGDARICPVVLDDDVETPVRATLLATRPISAYGTAQRIFTEGQRLAMIARDQGCSFVGCTVGATWTEAHHMTEWQVTKRTSVDDGALLCGYHHREFERLGWRGMMRDGIPHWLAPVWIDPTQTWRRNTAHAAAALV